MSSSTNPEKLVYLQNGVFKRKELTDGLQYYANNAFNTFALPAANGNYVLTNTNNVFTWTDAGDVSTGGEETPTFTSLDNSYFKGTDGQAIPIAAYGTIPYFKTNSTFGGINLPASGTYVLTSNGTTASFEALTEPVVLNGMGYDNTSNRYVIANWNSTQSNHKDLALPNKSGSFFLQADASSNYEFAAINAKSLFHENLGLESNAQKIVTYWGENAFGLPLPNTAGYATFKIENSSTSPLITNLTPQIIYQDILGCGSDEECLVYNSGNTVSKLTIPSTRGKYMFEVQGTGLPTFSLPDTKLSKTFEYNWPSAHQVVTESLSNTNTDLTEAITLLANRSYLITIDAVITCENYEPAIAGFTNTPMLSIGVGSDRIIYTPLNNPLPTTLASGSSVITPTSTNPLSITVARSGDTTITHTFSRLKVSVIEL